MQSALKTALLSFIAATFVAVPTFAAAVDGDTRLLAPAAGDLAAGELVTVAPPSLPGASREVVNFSWPLDPEQPLSAPAPHKAASREYLQQVSGADLRAGLAIFTEAPEALVRLSPIGDHDSLAAENFEVESASGEVYALGDGIEGLVDAEQLAAAGAPFSPGTTAFKVRAEVGAGELTLRAPEATAERYLLHVFDQRSAVSLDLQADRGTYLTGDALRAEGGLAGTRAAKALSSAEGFLVSPRGRTWPVNVEVGRDGTFALAQALPAGADLLPDLGTPGLWELNVNASGRVNGRRVVRSVRTAFALAAPTARLSPTTRAEVAKDGAVAVRLGLEVGVEGRYEARGVLWGTASGGVLRPAATAHAANWLAGGEGSLVLRWDAETLSGAGLHAPFEVRDLELLDQGRMGVLHRQARGLVLSR